MIASNPPPNRGEMADYWDFGYTFCEDIVFENELRLQVYFPEAIHLSFEELRKKGLSLVSQNDHHQWVKICQNFIIPASTL